MWMPTLRAAMEADCTAVARGTKRKDVALAACLGEMGTEFGKFERKADGLRAVFALFFPRKGGGGGGGGNYGGRY
jgi:hypothetical protein